MIDVVHPEKTKLLTGCGKMEANLICTTESSSLKNCECELSLEEEKYTNEKAYLKCFSGSFSCSMPLGGHPIPTWLDTGNIFSRRGEKVSGLKTQRKWGAGVGRGWVTAY